MTKIIKRALAVILALVICVLACSCTIATKTTISASGNVIQYSKMSIEKAKMENIKARLADKNDTVFNSEAEDESALITIEDTLVEFKEETVGDVTYLYTEQTTEMTIGEYNDGINMTDSNVAARVTTKDMWVYSPDLVGVSAEEQLEQETAGIAEVFEKLGIEIKTSSQIKFPYVITKTNCEKIDDYTIEPGEKPIYYVVTEASTADWANAEDIEAEITKMAIEKLKPTKPTYVKVSYASKNKFLISWDAMVWIENDDFTSIGNYRGNKAELQVKINDGEWKTHKVYTIDQIIGEGKVYYKFAEGKTYRFRVRSIRESETGAFETMYSSYKLSGEKQAAYLSNCPYVKVTTPKKGQIKVAFTKAQKIKVAGYRIRYSTDKNFKKGVKAVNVSASKMPKTIKGLKSGKTYYVQVRKYVKDAYGEKIFGANCKAKKIRVK